MTQINGKSDLKDEGARNCTNCYYCVKKNFPENASVYLCNSPSKEAVFYNQAIHEENSISRSDLSDAITGIGNSEFQCCWKPSDYEPELTLWIECKGCRIKFPIKLPYELRKEFPIQCPHCGVPFGTILKTTED